MTDPAHKPAGASGDTGVGRRELLAGAGLLIGTFASTATGAPPVTAAESPAPAPASVAGSAPDAMLTLNATEQAFVTAVVDTLIPADALSPSASACGVVTFIDRQLAGAWGGGARLYRSGPFLAGKPEHGYQLPLTPREYFAAGIAAVNEWTRQNHGGPIDALDEATRTTVLLALETGAVQLGGIPAAAFFEAFLAITIEAFFADPIYGGNRDKAGWRMIGYPGLPATYATAIEQYRGVPYHHVPKSIADFT